MGLGLGLGLRLGDDGEEGGGGLHLVLDLRKGVHQKGDGRELLPLGEAHVLGELVAGVLVVHTHLAHARLAHLALHRLEVLQHELEQRRLARTVGADCPRLGVG